MKDNSSSFDDIMNDGIQCNPNVVFNLLADRAVRLPISYMDVGDFVIIDEIVSFTIRNPIKYRLVCKKYNTRSYERIWYFKSISSCIRLSDNEVINSLWSKLIVRKETLEKYIEEKKKKCC